MLNTLRRLFRRRHRWQYRNPYDRTCRTCGRHEVAHGWAAELHIWWWEVFDEGDQGKHQGGRE